MPGALAQHARALEPLLAGGQPAAVPPGGRLNGDLWPVNPTEYLLLVAPLGQCGEPAGALELFLRADKPGAVQRGYLSLLEQVRDIARAHLSRRSARQAEAGRALWGQREALGDVAAHGVADDDGAPDARRVQEGVQVRGEVADAVTRPRAAGVAVAA